MHFKTLVAASLTVLGVIAAPRPQSDCTLSAAYGDHSSCSDFVPGVTTTTLSLTLTITSTHTVTATTSTSGPTSSPPSPYGLISARSASPIHLQTWNAAGLRFYLGGKTASYCPEQVQRTGSCPPGNSTVFSGTCAMDVMVPGGQAIYVTPSGEIGYTQAHSASMPTGSKGCPFVWSKPAGSNFGYITLNPTQAFGATGFMGCPTNNGSYQVFADIKNATVPQGDVTKCLGFSALASDYAGGLAAWQYT